MLHVHHWRNISKHKMSAGNECMRKSAIAEQQQSYKSIGYTLQSNIPELTLQDLTRLVWLSKCSIGILAKLHLCLIIRLSIWEIYMYIFLEGQCVSRFDVF